MKATTVTLNPAQQSAVEHYGTPLLVIAGAGTGKTQVITSKISYLIENRAVDPESILAITFTKKAAIEMKTRIKNTLNLSLDWILTFHSLCVKILRDDISKLPVGYLETFTIYSNDDSLKLIGNILQKYELKTYKPEEIKEIISQAKQSPRDTSLSYYVLQRNNVTPLIANIVQDYEHALLESNALDYDDILFYAHALLNGYATVRKKWQEQFQHVLVDEYQDTNVIQYEILKHLAGKNPNVTVVGDPLQAIYTWRGAIPKNILAFEEQFRPRIIKLECNYRSGEKIISVANALIQKTCKEWQQKVPILWANKKEDGVVSYKLHLVSEDEGAYMADQIKLLMQKKGYKLSDFAVLLRVSFLSRVIEDAFVSNQIQYKVVDDMRFYEKPEVKELLSYLIFFTCPRDGVAFERAINTPKRILERSVLTAIKANYKSSYIQAIRDTQFTPELQPQIDAFLSLYDMFSKTVEHSPYKTLMSIIEQIEYYDYLEQSYKKDYKDKIRSVSELLTALKEAESSKSTFSAFYENLLMVGDKDKSNKEEKENVKIMTIHSAKGLEFPVVFVPALEEGIFPYEKCTTLHELEEERRLFYVAITRAKEYLYLSSVVKRLKFGEMLLTKQSRFLEEIKEHKAISLE